MVRIQDSNLSNKELETINDLLMINNISLEYDDLYEINVDGERKYLVVNGNSFYVVDLIWGIDKFSVVDGSIVYYSCSKTNVALKGGAIYQYDGDDRIVDSLSLVPYQGETIKYRSVNAAINHIHYDYENMLKYVLFYYYFANFDGKDKIAESYLSEPYFVRIGSLEDKSNVKDYYLTHWYDEEKCYNLGLLKTVGLFNYLSRDYAGEIDVYYDRLVKCNGDVMLKQLLFAEQFNPDDIDNIILDRGFDGHVSPLLIDCFNREDNTFRIYQEIYKEYLKMVSRKKYVPKLAM